MKTGILHYERCNLGSQVLGSDDEHMISRVFFSMEYDGTTYPDLAVDIRQNVGGNYETDPVEVGRIIGYKGPMNYPKFREATERYYRRSVGSKDHDIQERPGNEDAMAENHMIGGPMRVEIEIDEQGTGR